MATAVAHDTGTILSIPGIVPEGFVIPPMEYQQSTTKFWGVLGESRINGYAAGRTLSVPIIIYDSVTAATFDTALKLATYVHDTLNTDQVGLNGGVTVTSESAHPQFLDCTFEGCILLRGIKKDFAGSLGGNYFAYCRLIFRQHA